MLTCLHQLHSALLLTLSSEFRDCALPDWGSSAYRVRVTLLVIWITFNYQVVTLATFELSNATTARPPASFEPGIRKIPPEMAEQLTDVGHLRRSPSGRREHNNKDGPDPTGIGGVVAGFGDQREVELLVEAGFTFVEAIHIATENGARFLQEENRIGTLAPGKQAELVVVRGDPSFGVPSTIVIMPD